MTDECDLAIVGAGPAGMAAAAVASDAGLSTVVLDEQGAPGGQIYRAIEQVTRLRPADLSFLGNDYARGQSLADGLRGSGADYRSGATVWHIGETPKSKARSGEREILYSQAGEARRLKTRSLLLATGAMERPVPIPGWTLPGVVTVGGLQTVLKSSGLYPEGWVILAGSGPLLFLLASQYIAAHIPIAAIVDTAPTGATGRMIGRMFDLGPAVPYLVKGYRMMRSVKQSGIPVYSGATDLRVIGGARAEGLAFRVDGQDYELSADMVALHEGVVPNTQLTRLVGAEHKWSQGQRCFFPVLDEWGESTAAGVYVAGDGGGILGADAAARTGRIAAVAIGLRLGRVGLAEASAVADHARFALIGDRAARRIIDAAFPPPNWIGAVADEVMVCRCEEVTAGAVREAVRIGCTGPNQAKAYLRCGMGPCQGRMCAAAVSEIIATESGRSLDEVGSFRIRPPAKPVTLAELASLKGGA